MKRTSIALFAASVALFLASLANLSPTLADDKESSTDTEDATEKLGLTREYAIEVCKPDGERAYLDLLRCPDGSKPEYKRVGSVGPRNKPNDDVPFDVRIEQTQRALKKGEPDYHMVDRYELLCVDKVYQVFLDMYHCWQPKPNVAPFGFSLSSED